MGSVGIRELRDGLSRYLERVKAGEGITVTEHGRPIARVVPYERRTLDELIENGLALPPTRPKEGIGTYRRIVPRGSVAELIDESR